ncbi:hypothetical protein KFK09_001817 [Dendrobium nobile]|uniref:Reverse transcriptase domain-containing protein n=1 Tax=Dendrobium nobile TaxID=94219 RepID=A0A8T3C615_DENNO|nr:hypothetical protein KFK09_001817 [Dendrobium nobile]
MISFLLFLISLMVTLYLNFLLLLLLCRIPKNNAITFRIDFRPISLCTFYYKLISKILMIRITILLHKLISPLQIGFVKGRAINDNILLPQEFCHDLDVKVRGCNMIVKHDVAKAYDNIDWNFLYDIIKLFGLINFINSIKVCIENPCYCIIVNNKTTGFFKASHGLR